MTNKVSPLADITTDMLSNRDFFGTEIRNTDEPIVKQLVDAAKFAGEQGFTPFGVRELQRARERGLSVKSQLLPFVGLVPPARRAISSPTERFLLNIVRQRSEISVPIIGGTETAKQFLDAAYEAKNRRSMESVA